MRAGEMGVNVPALRKRGQPALRNKAGLKAAQQTVLPTRVIDPVNEQVDNCVRAGGIKPLGECEGQSAIHKAQRSVRLATVRTSRPPEAGYFTIHHAPTSRRRIPLFHRFAMVESSSLDQRSQGV